MVEAGTTSHLCALSIQQNSSELAIMKREYFDRLKRMEAEYQTQERKAVELLELRRRAEIMQMEQEKNKHINTIIRNHEEAFEKTRQYHNEVCFAISLIVESGCVFGTLTQTFLFAYCKQTLSHTNTHTLSLCLCFFLSV